MDGGITTCRAVVEIDHAVREYADQRKNPIGCFGQRPDVVARRLGIGQSVNDLDDVRGMLLYERPFAVSISGRIVDLS